MIALYDAPAETAFADIRELKEKGHVCMFAHYKNWMNGKTLKITGNNFGCGGCGTWLFGKETKSRQEYIEFLADDEGLKADHDLMEKWFDNQERYIPEYDALFAGPYDERFTKYIKSITFFINPDQLSVFILAANYFFTTGYPEAVKAPFGSGCLELLPQFDSHDRPQAILGATDLAMRQYLPPNILAFTVNIPMYHKLCRLDENSFLSKPFLQRLKKARGGEV